MPPSPLQIKINALKRLIKEEGLYKKEAEEQAARVSMMKEGNEDEYDIRKQEEVLEEARKMVPEIAVKIAEHKEALREFLTNYTGDEDIAPAEVLLWFLRFTNGICGIAKYPCDEI